MSKHNIEAIFPLSPVQRGILFHSVYDQVSTIYTAQWSCCFYGAFNVEAFKHAWRHVVNRHSILRTLFLWEGREQPLQVVRSQIELPWDQQDWRDLAQEQQQEQLKRYLGTDRERKFDLAQAPLMRLALIRIAEESYRFIWSHHHLLLDGWSSLKLIEELLNFYKAFCRNQELWLERPRPYRDYIVWLRQQDMSAAEKFWRQSLEGFSSPTPLPMESDSSFSSTREVSDHEHHLHLSETSTAALQLLAREHGLTLNTLLLGAWALLLSRFSGEQDVLFGTTVSGRPTELVGVELMVGVFINTLPLRVRVSPAEPLLVWLKNIQTQQVKMRQYEYSPLVDIQGWSCVPRGQQLFRTILVFDNYPLRISLKQQLEADSDLTMGDFHVWESSSYTIAVVVVPGNRLELRIEYNSGLYNAATAYRILRNFQYLLESMVLNAQKRLSDLPSMNAAEQHQILVEWNNTQHESRSEGGVHRMIERQAADRPDTVAVGGEGRWLSYRELNRRANQLAHYLQRIGVRRGDLVGVCLEHGLEEVLGLLGVLKAGAGYVPLDPAHPVERMARMLSDAQVSVLLTEERLRAGLQSLRPGLLSLDSDWALVSAESDAAVEGWECRADIAYLIYTSGSTGEPKGVAISHEALVNYIEWAKAVYLEGENLSFGLYSSIAFDLTVTSIYTPLISGSAVMVYPRQGKEPPLERMLSEGEVGVLKLTPSHLSMIKERDNRGSGVKCLIVGGEAFEEKLAREVWESFGGEVKIYNEYGPTEATVGCMIYKYEADERQRAMVPIGHPSDNTQIFVLDEWLNPVAMEVIGEVYIGGRGLALGYWRRAETTAERFVATPFILGERLYRTGDLAKWVGDRELEYVGRTDEQIKYHGYRVELNEIRCVLNSHPQIKDSVVIVKKDDQQQQMMVAYYVSGETLEVRSLRAFLSEHLLAETIPGIFVHLDQLPLTLNGKVNYEALPTLTEAREKIKEKHEAPRTQTQEILAGIWAQVLGLEKIGIHNTFYELGGHSLMATRVVSRVRAAFQVKVSLRSLLEEATVAKLAERIETARRAGHWLQAQPLRRIPREDYLPLSFAQQRIWFLDQLNPGSPAYNTPSAIRLAGALNVIAMEQSLSEVVRRHEALRTTFPILKGRPFQAIAPPPTISLPIVDLGELRNGEAEAQAQLLTKVEARRSFKLSRGPLLRGTLLRLSQQLNIGLFTLHHIVSDGWSKGVLIEEVMTLHQAFTDGKPSDMPELTLQYVDFASWQREALQGKTFEAQLAYWEKQLSDAPTRLNLTSNRPSPSVRTYRSARESFMLSQSVTQALIALSRREQVTLFMVLLAAFKVILHYYSGQCHIVVGTAIADRNRVEIERLIGCFVNLLVLHTDLSGNPTFKELLQRVREVVLGAYAHQDVPFDALVEGLNPDRDTNRTPLIQVAIVLQNNLGRALELAGLTVEDVETDTGTAKFDLVLTISEEGTELNGSLDYCTDLFDKTTVYRLITHFETMLQYVPTHSETTLAEMLETLNLVDRQLENEKAKELKESRFHKYGHVRRKPIRGSLLEEMAT
jgi:amino acid adenylation domain-containing protein